MISRRGTGGKNGAPPIHARVVTARRIAPDAGRPAPSRRSPPKVVRKYADVAGISIAALSDHVADVRGRSFPEEQHCYGMLEGEAERLAARATEAP